MTTPNIDDTDIDSPQSAVPPAAAEPASPAAANPIFRSDLIERLRRTFEALGHGYVFFSMGDPRLLIPVVSPGRLSAEAAAELARVRDTVPTADLATAQAISAIDAGWGVRFAAMFLSHLSDEFRGLWVGEGDDIRTVGYVTADGSVFAWSSRGRVIAPSAQLASALGLNAL